jgi:prepilin-type N-terminal cleavage/methylation domain-containing protein
MQLSDYKNKGFTLLEMIISVVVIIILLTIILALRLNH